MRKVALLLLMVVALFGVSSVMAQGGGQTVVILEDGVPQLGTFEGEKTAQLYGFNGSAGDSIIIAMTQLEGSELDPFFVLLGERGEVYASDDDSGVDVQFSARIKNFELPYDGSYFILATSFIYIDNILEESNVGLVEPQDYELVVSGITAPEGLDGFDPNLVTFYKTEVGYGVEGYAEVTIAEPVYYFTFAAHAGDRININASSSEFDTIIHLFDSEGIRIAVNDDLGAGNTNSAIQSFTVPADGEYLFFVTDVRFYDVSDPTAVESRVGEFELAFS
jgi:hypothetical protein